MKSIVAALSLLTLAAGTAGAQAQMLGDGGDASATLRGVAPSQTLGGGASLDLRGADPGDSRSPGRSVSSRSSAVMTAEALGPGESPSIAIPSTALAAPVKKVAEPWCRSGRIAGSGMGFCLIN